ncbi:MAG: hypothetical protein HYS08_08845 [Chlamydiae bacterium]|nr:hypothetical protein [Chlamydiota bacterium]MBI3265470.1 hypothetical protein [Chlamydiota bacterium]
MITLYIKIGEEEISAVFQDLSPPRKVKQIPLEKRGEEVFYHVTGWSNPSSPASAFAQRITDSGDAQAILIHGGDAGILLKPTNLTEDWNPESPQQEQRPYLVLSFADEKNIIYDEDRKNSQ